jgi:hypothetical protein
MWLVIGAGSAIVQWGYHAGFLGSGELTSDWPEHGQLAHGSAGAVGFDQQ